MKSAADLFKSLLQYTKDNMQHRESRFCHMKDRMLYSRNEHITWRDFLCCNEGTK